MLRNVTRLHLRSTHSHWVQIWQLELSLASGGPCDLWKTTDAYSSTAESFQLRECGFKLDGEDDALPIMAGGGWVALLPRLLQWLAGPGQRRVCVRCGALEDSPQAALPCERPGAGQHHGVLGVELFWETGWQETMGQTPIPASLEDWLVLPEDWRSCCMVTWSCCAADVSVRSCSSAHWWRKCLHGTSIMELASINVNVEPLKGQPQWKQSARDFPG